MLCIMVSLLFLNKRCPKCKDKLDVVDIRVFGSFISRGTNAFCVNPNCDFESDIYVDGSFKGGVF